jgi:LysM repeat protein
MKKTALFTVLVLLCGIMRAQTITVEQYINTYKNLAISEMKRSGIPASVILAQGILETENGNSELVKISNNHFGIKCKSTWTGETVTHTDDAPDECFRKYSKAEDSYRDHSDYLKATPRYASLFQLDPSDYKGWAYGLKRAGYATNPRYPEILINNIEKYNLQQYDLIAPNDSDIAVVQKPEEKMKAVPVPVAVPAAAGPEIILKENTKLNGLKAFYAPKGTSLLAIATKADIPLAKLLEYNDLAEDGLLKTECWIYLEKKAKQGNRDIYTSLQDETLYEISQNNGVQLKSLSALNNIPEDARIKKGTKVKLRASEQLTDSK